MLAHGLRPQQNYTVDSYFEVYLAYMYELYIEGGSDAIGSHRCTNFYR